MNTARAMAMVAAGAVLGAWARWGLGLWLNPRVQVLALGTLAANWLGSALAGAALMAFAAQPADHAGRLLLVTGFLGAFTTMSAFSTESVQLLGRGAFGTFALHALLHAAGSVLAAWLGAWGWRAFASL